MEELVKFLKAAGTYYLGTVEDGKPDIRPFGTIHIYEDKVYFQTGRNKNVYKQIKENNSIHICAMYEDKWIRINAQAIEDNRIEAEQSMLDAYPNLQNMYKAGDGNTVVFYLENVSATIYSFASEPVEINF